MKRFSCRRRPFCPARRGGAPNTITSERHLSKNSPPLPSAQSCLLENKPLCSSLLLFVTYFYAGPSETLLAGGLSFCQ